VFERYTESARRAVFFARHAASQRGSVPDPKGRSVLDRRFLRSLKITPD
jgi:hypothetical protein